MIAQKLEGNYILQKIIKKRSDCSYERIHLHFKRSWTSNIVYILWSQHLIPCPYTLKKWYKLIQTLFKNKSFLQRMPSIICKNSHWRGELKIVVESSWYKGSFPLKKSTCYGRTWEKITRQVRYKAITMHQQVKALKKNFGELEPPNLSKSNIIRKIKYELSCQQMQFPKEDDPIWLW